MDLNLKELPSVTINISQVFAIIAFVIFLFQLIWWIATKMKGKILGDLSLDHLMTKDKMDERCSDCFRDARAREDKIIDRIGHLENMQNKNSKVLRAIKRLVYKLAQANDKISDAELSVIVGDLMEDDK